MKKQIQVVPFGASDTRHSNEQLIAYRRKETLFIQNLELLPLERFKVEHDVAAGAVVITIRLGEAECLTIQDAQGIAEKRQIEGKRG